MTEYVNAGKKTCHYPKTIKLSVFTSDMVVEDEKKAAILRK